MLAKTIKIFLFKIELKSSKNFFKVFNFDILYLISLWEELTSEVASGLAQ